jgi:glutaminase
VSFTKHGCFTKHTHVKVLTNCVAIERNCTDLCSCMQAVVNRGQRRISGHTICLKTVAKSSPLLTRSSPRNLSR